MRLQNFPHGKTSHWSLGCNTLELEKYLADAVPEGQIDLVMMNVIAGICEPIDPFGKITGDKPFFNATYEMHSAASPDLLLVSLALKTVDRTVPQIDWMEMDRTPEAVRFQLSQNVTPCFAAEYAFELARIVTPDNHYSIIKSIQTGLTFEDAAYRWPRGDSVWYTRQVDAGPPIVGELHVEWAIKVESRQLISTLSAFRVLPITVPANWLSEVPGIIHPEMEPWEQMLFLWGRDHYVRLRCPANSVVSLWIYFRTPVGSDGAGEASGMLKAQTQICNSCRAFKNITEMD